MWSWKRLIWYGRAEDRWINMVAAIGKRRMGKPRQSWRNKVDDDKPCQNNSLSSQIIPLLDAFYKVGTIWIF